MTYVAPLREQLFALAVTADLPGLARLPAFEAATLDLVEQVLAESGKLAANVLAPLNRVGDRMGARLEDGQVTLPPGFQEGYDRYAEGGWVGLAADPAFGGQGLPFALTCAVQEQVTSANMAFALCPMLTQGAISALTAHASEALKQTYLARLILGEWTGTMALTEPQAGSDVGALRTQAIPRGDGSYRLKGGKIFITWGDHDLAPNIVHLVLARLPDAPAGPKGVSLFVAPKRLVNPDGTLGAANGVSCTAIEHKLGINASPTCALSFGEDAECVGWLVGAEHGGMRAMFTMMNHARINVALQGVAIGEAAYQHALAYARERVQSARFGAADRAPVRIIEHADIRRTVMTMRATVEAARAICYFTAAAVDRAHAEPDEDARREAQGLADLMTPVSKAYATDIGVEVASLGLQVFGGMGFIEETGAAQFYRDARIAPIYEGTNGIQAMDLVGRKLGQAGGEPWRKLFAQAREFAEAPAEGALADIKARLVPALEALDRVTLRLADAGDLSADDRAAGATPYLRMFAVTVGAWLLARQAQAAQARLAAGADDADFLTAKIATAAFFAGELPQATALADTITGGAARLYALSEEQLAR
jgi:alkylation response protein AidB-like acyl-CoA dehydrogenase